MSARTEKLTDLDELLSVATDDFLYIVDVSDTTDSAAGSSKKIKASNAVPAGLYDANGAASSAIAAHLAASDPHPQYLTTAEGNVAYDVSGAASSAISAHLAAPDPHSQYLTTTRGNAAYDALGAASSAITAHLGATDPHSQYLNTARGNAAYQAIAGRVVTADGDVTMVTADRTVIVKKTTPAATNVNSPVTMVAWKDYIVKDGALNAGTYPITVLPPSGMTFEGGQSSVLINQDGWSLTFQWDGATTLYIV